MYKLQGLLQQAFPGSIHADSACLHAQADSTTRNFARDNGFTIVSKDDDFRQLCFLHDAPPRVIRLSVGNAATDRIVRILNLRCALLEEFVRDSVLSLLILEIPQQSA